VTENEITEFSEDQIVCLKKCALDLLSLLEECQLSESEQLLNGGLRSILNAIIESENPKPLDEVPFFSLMMRDYLPERETKAYFNFYSMARYGEIAYPKN
jgi:hypothetical protein